MSADKRRAPRSQSSARPDPPGLAARRRASDLVLQVTAHRRSLDGAFENTSTSPKTNPADLALVQTLVLTSLRHLGTLDAAIGACLERPLRPANSRAQAILRIMAAQLLVLRMPPHAAVALAVEDAARDPKTRAIKRLVNAVGRRMEREGTALLPATTPFDTPPFEQPRWMVDRWIEHYGSDMTAAMTASLRHQPAIDVTPNPRFSHDDPLGNLLDDLTDHQPARLFNGSIRLAEPGRIPDLPGFADGRWWVQDVAASLPAHLLLERLEDPAAASVLDLCAAPGGKTAQLAAAGAQVTAIDQSKRRMERVHMNLSRLNLRANTIVGDALTATPEGHFQGVLLDAPCSATGTLRRNPDLAYVRKAQDIDELADLQAKLLALASSRVAPDGVLVYATCSLEPEEGERQVQRFLRTHPEWAIDPVEPGAAPPDSLRADGTVRTLPHMAPLASDGAMESAVPGGMDGFFIARLKRN